MTKEHFHNQAIEIYFRDNFLAKLQSERLLNEAEKEQEEINDKKLIADIQKLNEKNISHFDYPSQTYSYCDRVKLEPIITYKICNKCNSSGLGKWWLKCEKCKGKVFVKVGGFQEKDKILLPIKKIEKFI